LKNLVTIGKITASSGLKGRMKVMFYAESPKILETVECVFVGRDSSNPSAFKVHRIIENGRSSFIELGGIDSADSANALKGHYIFLSRREMAEPGDDEYYWHDIIGLDVLTERGEHLGKISAVFPTGSNDVYVCKSDKGEILLPVPAIDDVIRKIDVTDGTIIVELLEGL